MIGATVTDRLAFLIVPFSRKSYEHTAERRSTVDIPVLQYRSRINCDLKVVNIIL